MEHKTATTGPDTRPLAPASLAMRELVSGDGTLTLTLDGELDMLTSPRLAERLAEARGAGTDAVVDLRGVRFMDSTGLRIVLDAHFEAAHSGCALALIQGPPHVRRVFEVTRTLERLTFIDV
jgi:anti-anti-sigma factor